VPVTLTLDPAFGTPHTFHLRTNKHGYYRKTIRAVAVTHITVQSASTGMYLSTPMQYYVQNVRGNPRCVLPHDHARVNHFVVLSCHLRPYATGSKFLVQFRIHGKWWRGGEFSTSRDNHTKIFVRRRKPGTLVVREVFPRSTAYSRSISNTVRLHVS
jgi:hypothetical protein